MSTQERKQSVEEYSHTQVTPGPELGHGITSESTVISDSAQAGSDSPLSIFKPITAPSDTSEERTLSPPQCRLEYRNVMYGLDLLTIKYALQFCFHTFSNL